MTALHDPPADLDTVLRIIANRADTVEDSRDLSADMALLHRSGILGRLAHDEADPEARVGLFRALGRANLSVGRLAEGHVNALELISLYGSREQKDRCLNHARDGDIFGVWGAEGTPPVGIVARHPQGFSLSGRKNFCSGLGLVRWAVITIDTQDGPQLALAEVGDPARHDLSRWDVSGMKATASGVFDFADLPAGPLGQPGDYLREPYFEGGIWRYVALHVGGLEAVADCVRTDLSRFEPGPAALHRLGRIVILARTARLMVEDAAQAVAAADTGPSIQAAVTLCLLARQAVEDACVEALQLADRTLGTRSFARGHPLERLRRDLGFFLRQANLDGKMERAAHWLRTSGGSIATIWDS